MALCVQRVFVFYIYRGTGREGRERKLGGFLERESERWERERERGKDRVAVTMVFIQLEIWPFCGPPAFAVCLLTALAFYSSVHNLLKGKKILKFD